MTSIKSHISLLRHFAIIMPCFLLLATSACTDTINYPENGNVPEGEPATISIGIEVQEMKKITRADDGADYNRVASLWVGIFNASTGKFTGGGMMTEKDNGFKIGNTHDKYSLKNINAKSGNSYIVGVANPENYNAITTDNRTSRNLKDILDDEDIDWKTYKSIVITEARVQNNAVDIQAPTVDNNYGLIMSGIYAADGTKHPINEENAVAISPDANQLTDGAIHLRLLQSHIKFNIHAEKDIIELTPQSYQVYNVPSSSWLHEHVKTGETLNSGDALLNNTFDKEKNKDYYGNSLLFTSTSFTKEVKDGVTHYSFDFWQMENKRTGLESSCNEYADREKEYGTDGKYIPEGEENYKPTGLFMSLTPFDNPTLNNMATYVDIPCVVKYKAKTTYDNAKPGDNPAYNDLLENDATRIANITYRIHLGYVNPTKDPRDFNTYRNSDYTYNVTVSNLHNVLVEAFRVGDPQPGGFGDVTDVSDKFFTLDAHYGVFNIELTEEELKKFSFRMLSYENNIAHEIIMGDLDKPDTVIKDENRKYYNWISLLPTNSTDMSVIAAYPKDKTKLLYLEDFLPIVDETTGEKEASQKAGFYTVFVNEYTYENGPDETGGNWKNYVNQPDRMLWINVNQKTSADGTSAFYKAKYALAQHSIQTYYNTENSTEAIGVEHENENFGMNIRWTRDIPDQPYLNANNGRINVWNNIPKNWEEVVDFTQIQHVNGIDNTKVASYITENQCNGEDKNIPLIKLLSRDQLKPLSEINNGNIFNQVSLSLANEWDPQTGTNDPNVQYVQAMYSCMNRNRDENGNGVIEKSELKWYLPASGKYLRVILGRNSLVTPIMNYKNQNLPYAGIKEHNKGPYDFDGLYHLISSDDKLIWADQGMASSRFAYNDPYTCAPWQVRCVRNLGKNLSLVNKNNDVTPAYTTYPNGTGAVVKVSNYYGTSLRNPSEVPLPVHKTNSEYNRLGRYGFEVAYIGNTVNSDEYGSEAKFYYNKAINFESAINNASPCEVLNNYSGKKGWRVPNQKELAIMLRFKYSDNDDDYMLKFYGGYTDFFASCTISYWNTDGYFSSDIDIANYLIITCIQNYSSLLREMSAQTVGNINYVRCVRDLQPGDYPDLK